MSARRYWLYYCKTAGLSSEVSKQVVKECEKCGSFNDIDWRIKQAKLASEVSKATA